MKSLSDDGFETLALDVTQTSSIRQARDLVNERTGGELDVLINNAGITYPASASDMSIDRAKALFDVNLFGHMAVVQEFLPLLLASKNSRVVNIASLAGLMPVPFNSAYNASKAALLSYGDTLRVELAPFNVQVINVAAGNVQSNIMHGADRNLPSNSIYYPINDEFQRNRIDHFQDGAIPASQFAATVVAESLKPRPRAWLYTAKNSWTVWLISTFMGRRGFDYVLSKMFGLRKLSKIIASQGMEAVLGR